MGGMHFYGKKVCFLGAHPDDIELGCGALIARIVGKADVRCQSFDLFHSAAQDRHLRTAGGQGAAESGAEDAGSAGDHGYLPLQIGFHRKNHR